MHRMFAILVALHAIAVTPAFSQDDAQELTMTERLLLEKLEGEWKIAESYIDGEKTDGQILTLETVQFKENGMLWTYTCDRLDARLFEYLRLDFESGQVDVHSQEGDVEINIAITIRGDSLWLVVRHADDADAGLPEQREPAVGNVAVLLSTSTNDE